MTDETDNADAKIEHGKPLTYGEKVAGATEPKKQSVTSRAADSARENAGPLGVGLPVIGLWLLSVYGGIEPPAHVASAIGGILGAAGMAIGAHIRRRLS